eukprot:CAMPEP_0194205886 /NCGR_PEP_ID=MMETSP0156-20130528/5055_1 /TAXON_ID=33649 /ORGANISM="Thalassionema nitzschioides, Strain L26-B" /LENGTH=521 /DNA_ID=CAMNT_0038932271 /DNA_START=69 /DNA_END=1631 /DNA_ORIENTATION=-
MGRSKKTQDDVNNAYDTTDDDWTLDDDDSQITESRVALSNSIQQHALNLREADGAEQFEDEFSNRQGSVQGVIDRDGSDSRLGSHRSGMSSQGTRSMTSSHHSSSRGPSLSSRMKSSRSSLKSSTRYSKDNDEASMGATTVSTRSRVSFSSTAKAPLVHSKQTKTGTRIRALICCGCLAVSIVLAFVIGHHSIGGWFANVFMQSAHGDEDLPGEGGLPGSIGSHPQYNETFDIPDLASMNIMLPEGIDNFADWRIRFPANRTDLPVFWMIPKGGISVVQRILGQCFGLVEFSKEGAGSEEKTLQILESPLGTRYVNMDSYTVAGLQRAIELKVVESSLADVMFTPLLLQSTSLFTTPGYHGRFFAVFRHPIERAMGMYYAAKKQDPSLQDMSIIDFAARRLPNNELVRILANKSPDATLNDDDLHLAMEIIRRKCVIGLVSQMEKSLFRFYGVFGWHSKVADGVTQCQKDLLKPAEDSHVALPQGEALLAMLNQNRMDIKLYQYIEHMFEIQGGNGRDSEW